MAQCVDCDHMNLYDRNSDGKAYCELKKTYYEPYSSSCWSYSDNGHSHSYNSSDEEKGKENSSSGCYLTTIVCDILGLSDNCQELQILRMFRDEYMMGNKEYFPLLIEYNVVGPIISEYIDNDINRKSIAISLKNNYIDKAIKLIREQAYESAIEVYVNMVESLKNRYYIYFDNRAIEEIINNEDINILDKDKAKQLAKKINFKKR